MEQIRNKIKNLWIGIFFTIPYLMINFFYSFTAVKFRQEFTENMYFLFWLGVFLVVGKETLEEGFKLWENIKGKRDKEKE